jgi:DNA repair protein RecN (Recombination protein N)
MLASLTVRDVVLIERAELNFAPGLNVLTGETGAGKSILLDALGLAAGERAPGRTVLRPDADQASVIAVFEVGQRHPARALLATNDLDSGTTGEIILRRTVSTDGRSRAFINDAPVGVQLVREIGEALLEVHGQADDRGLFDASTHRMLLDAFGGDGTLADETASRFAALKAAEKRQIELRRAREAASRERDFLDHAAKELADLAPHAGEDASLTHLRALLMNAERLAKDVSTAAELISGETGAQANLASALRRLSRLPPEGRQAAGSAEAALDCALTYVEDARRQLEALLTRLDVEPGKLEQTEERLFALRAVARKHNVAPDALPELLGEFKKKLAALDGSHTTLAAADADVARTRAAYLESARALSAARGKAARKLETVVTAELAPLKLAGARFRVALTPLPADEAGTSRRRPRRWRMVGF